jgi:hypothetical protein
MAAGMLRHRDFAETFAAADPSVGADRVIFAALPDDRVGTILDSLDAYGGSTVNVVIPSDTDDSAFGILSFSFTDDTPAENVSRCEIHDDAELGMLVAYMRTTRRAIRLVRLGHYEMELVEDGSAGELTSA